MSPAPVTCFYDASCPVCALEMGHLASRARPGELTLIDISVPGFDAGQFGFAAPALDAAMHAVDGEGRVVRGMSALRLVYAAAGLGWVIRFTALPGLRPLFDAAYRLFARHRRAVSRMLAPLVRAVERQSTTRRRATH